MLKSNVWEPEHAELFAPQALKQIACSAIDSIGRKLVSEDVSISCLVLQHLHT